jgi:VIT1/CCC1 family predicted Fe2+/Mn2+ transporter
MSIVKFLEECQKKEIDFVVKSRGYRDNISIPADFFLSIASAPERKIQEEKTKILIPFYIASGVLLGTLLIVPFLIGLQTWLAYLVSVFFGGLVAFMLGWTSRTKEIERRKALVEQIQRIADRLKMSVMNSN